MSEKEAGDRGSGARTVAVLKQVAEFGGGFTLSALAGRTGLPASSLHRLLQPLIAGGLVERAGRQAYQPGREFLRIAALVLRETDVRALAAPILRQLWADWQETATFCAYRPETGRAMVVETLQTPHPLRYVLEPFAELSLIWGSLGRAILAFLSEAEADRALAAKDVGVLSGQAAPPRAELEREINLVRRQGYALYRNDSLDVAGVAAPVRRAGGTIIGSLGLTMPSRRLAAEAVEKMALAVVAAAAELSKQLGHQPEEIP